MKKQKSICVLSRVFSTLLISLSLFFVSAQWVTLLAQQKTQVTGKVSDSTGEPAIGASVIQKGTSIGTITDIEGNFSLFVSSGSTLQISYIGYVSQEIKAVSGRNLAIKLIEDTKALDEVVVVGYGTQKKSDVTGSVTSVSKDRLGRLPVTNVLQAVQGAAAGVTITQTSSIPGDAPDALVRGRNSINASSGPYVVVDGVPISKSGGTLNDINPNDIESMEILKDASATAIYGTNGANGVILITTKRGNTGKPTIRYNGYLGIEDFTNKLDFCNGEQIIQRYKDYVSQNPGETLFDGYVKNQYESDNYQKGLTTDWIDAVSQTGIIQNHNVNIAGGAENVKYYVSADYIDQKGIIKGFNYKRFSVRTNLDMNVTDYLTVGTNTYIVSHNRDGGRANLLMAEAMSPYAKMYNEDGSYCINPMYSETLFTNPLMWTTTNPERRQFNLNINGYAEMDFGKLLKPLAGLKYKFNGGFAYVPKRTNEYEGKSVNKNSGWGRIKNEETQSYTIENILSYTRDLGKHHVDLTALYAASRKKYQSSTAEAEKFINDDQEWNNMGSAETQKVGSYTDLYTTVSQMGRFNYSYDSCYLFTFTVRRDGSSVFGDNNKYGTFPSVALGWNIARENFMAKANDWLNTLKLRLSYGKAGNEAIGVYQSRMKMESGMLTMNGSSTAALWLNDLMGNNDLSWETTKSFNIGLDFGLWNNRVNGNVDMYFSKTNDLLLKRSLPKISGYNTVYTNMGETFNKGLEVTLNSRNIAKKDFTWNSTLVFSWNKNEIKDLYGDGKDDLGNRWFLGHPISVIYDYVKVGVWQTDEIASGLHKNWDPIAEAGDIKLADISGADGKPDGKIDDYDRKIQGQTTPKWIGGLTNTFTYKDLTLSVFIQTVQGLKKNNSLIGIAGDEMGRRNTTTEVGYWTPENKSNEWRSLRKNSNKHGYEFPSDASFTRIKDITLSYNLPKSAISKIGLDALQMYVSGRNLFTFTDWIGWDPEARQISRGSSSWDSTRGERVYDNSNYPSTKSFVFGINVTF
nr:TonB-dependent receptor [uncultured Bacteroides sp.]